MPIFDFRCSDCGHEFEAITLGDGDRIQCPKCRGDDLERSVVSLFHCTGVQLNKRLKMESEEQIKKGQEMMKSGKFSKKRMKIL